MVMKIIRHSRKMFVYSLPLLLYLQHLSCIPPIKSDTELFAIAEGHNNTDMMIDTLQKTLGGMSALDHGDTRNFKDSNIKELFEMQEQRMTYDAAWLFVNSEYRKKDENKRKLRREFVAKTRTAEAAYGDFIPDTTNVRDLPQNPKRLNSIRIIDILQSALGAVQNKSALFLDQSVSALSDDLKAKHTFFQRIEESCCCIFPKERKTITQYQIYLRTRVIPVLCFAQLEKHKQTLAASPAIPIQISEQSYQNPDGVQSIYYKPFPSFPPPPFKQLPPPTTKSINKNEDDQ
jgi:hypothetical protein